MKDTNEIPVNVFAWQARQVELAHTPTRTREYLLAYKSLHGLKTDAQLARDLGVWRMSVHRWMNGKSHLPEALAARVAQALGLDARDVLADIATERQANRTLNAQPA